MYSYITHAIYTIFWLHIFSITFMFNILLFELEKHRSLYETDIKLIFSDVANMI